MWRQINGIIQKMLHGYQRDTLASTNFVCSLLSPMSILQFCGERISSKDKIEQSVWVGVASCLSTHARVILVFISRVVKQRGK